MLPFQETKVQVLALTAGSSQLPEIPSPVVDASGLHRNLYLHEHNYTFNF